MGSRLPRPPLCCLSRGGLVPWSPQDASAAPAKGGGPPACCQLEMRPFGSGTFRPPAAAAKRRQQHQQLLLQLMQPQPAAAAAVPKPSFEGPPKASSRRRPGWSEGLPEPQGLGAPSVSRGPRVSGGPTRAGLRDSDSRVRGDRFGDRVGYREASLLVSNAVEAARLGCGSPSYWAGMARRAAELAGFLSAADVAALLHALSRSSGGTRGDAAAACAELAARVEALLPVMSSLQLTQTVSAWARLQLAASPELLQMVRKRIECLLSSGEFQQPFEVAMLLSAASKLQQLADAELLERLAAHVRLLLLRGPFPLRDLAVVAKALSACGAPRLEGVFVCLADAAVRRLSEATCLDLARLLQAFAVAAAKHAAWPEQEQQQQQRQQQEQQQQQQQQKHEKEEEAIGGAACGAAAAGGGASFAAAHRRLFEACVDAAGDRIPAATPAELSLAAHAFGAALLACQGTDSRALAAVLDQIR
ncbi:hypothetical protein Efla_007543 [Eimeria flavescens]